MISRSGSDPTAHPIPTLPPDDFEGLRVLVFGLGRFGGGLGAATFFAERGAEVTVTDLRSADQLGEAASQVMELSLHKLILGGHDEQDFDSCEWLVVNPAVRPDNPLLARAVAAGATPVTEMDLFLRWCPSTSTAGITGTNGKSTTVRLAGDMLSASGHRVWLGGNIGRSLLSDVDLIGGADPVVLELSSFQLARLSDATPRPRAVAITQYSPNHLDWHGDEREYRAAKERLLRGRKDEPIPREVAVLPADSPHLASWSHLAWPRRILPFAGDHFPEHGIGFEESWLTVEDSRGRIDSFLDASAAPLVGVAQRANIACAAAVALTLGAHPEGMDRALRQYVPLPHRQQRVASAAGVLFVDDSKATTPEAAICALEAFGPKVVLIAGGSDKGASFEHLAAVIARCAHTVALTGPTAPAIAEALAHTDLPADRVLQCADFGAAFRLAADRARPGDAVLLAPACASFDEFASYEERGQRFEELAREWCREHTP